MRNLDPYAPALDAAITPAARIHSAPLEWLWPGRIPNAQLTLLVGDPGTGKSLLAAEIAARISAPKAWPDDAYLHKTAQAAGRQSTETALDGRYAEGFLRGHAVIEARPPDEAPPSDNSHRFPWTPNPLFRHDDETASSRHPHAGAAIIASPEDHAAQILIPRLEAAGANLRRVSVLYGVTRRDYPDGPVSPLILPDNIRVLQGAACHTVEARLLVLDPLHALLSTAAQCSPAILAGLLADLADFARKFNIAVLATVHLAKARRTRALHNIRGSIALTAAARAAHLLTIDPDDADRRILSPLKSVYGPPPPALAFRISTGPRVDWEREPVLASAELLDIGGAGRAALTEACDWLTDYLREGSRATREVLSAAGRDGIKAGTLYRAKRLLNIRSSKSGSGHWVWHIPGF